LLDDSDSQQHTFVKLLPFGNMESSEHSPTKSDVLSPAYDDQLGSQSKQLSSGVPTDAGSDPASPLRNMSVTATELPGNPRPSHRVIPPDEPGTHQVTFTVTISVAFPPGETVLHVHVKNMF